MLGTNVVDDLMRAKGVGIRAVLIDRSRAKTDRPVIHTLADAAGGVRLDRLSDYDYDCRDELIAQTPLADRAASRCFGFIRAVGRGSAISTVPEI